MGGRGKSSKRMFLSEIGDRRSGTTRVMASAALLATLLGPLRLGWAASNPGDTPASRQLPQLSRASQRIRPIAVEDVAGKLGEDALWRLFDQDASTGLSAAGPTRIRVTFSEPLAVTAMGGFGAASGSLALRGPDGGENVGSGELDGTQRWTRVVAKSPREARTFVIEWTPKAARAALPELEIWGRLVGRNAADRGPGLPDALFGSLPEGAESLTTDDSNETRSISVATPPDGRAFSVTVPYDTRAIERAFLAYELDGLPNFTAAERTINGGPAVGGFGVSRGAKGGLQIEEISPVLLRRGANSIGFVPVTGNDPVGYQVRGLRLVVTHAADALAVDDGAGLSNGSEAIGWEGESGAIRRWHFSGAAQPREVRIRVWRRQEGKLIVAAGSAAARRTTTIDLDKLDAGWHEVALDSFPPVGEMTLGLEAARGGKIQLADVAILGSPLPAPEQAGLRVTYPLHGECVNHEVHVRGLVAPRPSELRAAGALVRRPVFETGAFSFTASEKELGGNGGKPFSFAIESVGALGRAQATVAIAGCVDRPAAVADADGATVQPREDIGAPYGVVVKAKKATKLAFADVELDVPAGAVDKDVRVTIRPLSPNEVPTLETGMNNVTAGGRAFRLGPRGMAFKKPVTLSVPVDRTRFEPGEAVRTFYFDEPARQWREVPVAESAHERVVAQTTHFTDFIAATLALPEHPGLQSLDPTSLKQIKVADPAAGVELMAPPEANSEGTANLNYPIEIPPGRLEMEPHLAITYDSSRANGWLGIGWDLSVSSIEIDTRFGVPKYDGTERYSIDGEALAPATAAPAGAPAGTYYLRRNEKRFDWIQRVSVAGGGYSWLVTDKNGIKYTYGQSDTARLMPLNGSAVDHVRTFKWFLETAQDMNGNQVRYTYTVVRGNNGDPFVQVYPAQVSYTASSTGSPAPAYSVAFNLQAGNRMDAFSTGRPGFQALTQKLLDSVDVKNGASIVRKYKLTYMTGDFSKTLLKTIAVLGKGGTGTPIAQHDLSYFQTPRDANNSPKIFGSPSAATYATIVDPSGNLATGQSVEDLTGTNSSSSISVGVGGASHTKSDTIGGGKLEDMDGDGLPDYLPFSSGSSVGMKQSLQVQNGILTGPMALQSFPGLSRPYSWDTNSYMRSSYNLLATDGGQDFGNLSEAKFLHADINGDGLPDQVSGAPDDALHVNLNLGNFGGFSPEVVMPGYSKTGLGFDCSDVFGSGTVAAPSTQNRFPSADIITKWVAPYAGTIRITGPMTRQEAGGDGMIASLFLNNTKLWEHEFGPTDYLSTSGTSCTPQDAAPAVGSACGGAPVGFVRVVAKGDRVYTRVNAIANADP